jgi:hypothetical protein
MTCGLVCLMSGSSSSDLAVAMPKGKKAEAYCLLGGSAFNERGFSLPGVAIVVEMKLSEVQKVKKKKWELVSSPRGQFAVRLPPGKNSFLVTATKKGYKPIDKTVEFANDERQDIVFNMEPVTDQQ